MIKGAIFDIDGVVFDSIPVWMKVGEIYLKSLNIEAEADLGDRIFSMSLEESSVYIKEKYNLDLSPKEIFDGVIKVMETYFRCDAIPKEGVKELVQRFSREGVKLIVASSSPKAYIESALKRNGILLYFQEILTTSEIGLSKHHPDIFYEAAKRLDLLPNEIVVIEDSLYAAKTAKQVGFKLVGVYGEIGETNQIGLEEISDYYVKSLKELIEVEI